MSSKSIDASHYKGFTSHSFAKAMVKFASNGWCCCSVDCWQQSKHVLCFLLRKASENALFVPVDGWVMESEKRRDNLVFSHKKVSYVAHVGRKTDGKIWVMDWIVTINVNWKVSCNELKLKEVFENKVLVRGGKL